jgi:serine/threonine-protein kinase RsbW
MPSPWPGGVVELWVPAHAALIPTVRTVTADLAARAGFGFDAVSDLRMAVDEASSAAVTTASEDSPLYCRFVIASDHLVVTVSTRTDRAEAILDTTSFGWRILRALVDDVQLCADGPPDTTTGHAPSTWTGIRMIKRAAT